MIKVRLLQVIVANTGNCKCYYSYVIIKKYNINLYAISPESLDCFQQIFTLLVFKVFHKKKMFVLGIEK